MGRRSDKYSIDGVGKKAEKPKKKVAAKLVFAAALLVCAVMPFTVVGKKVLRKVGNVLGGGQQVVVREIEVEKIVKVPVEVKIPSSSVGASNNSNLVTTHDKAAEEFESLTKLSASSNILLKTKVHVEESDKLASADREPEESYQIDYSISVRLPKAAQTIEELEKTNPHLSSILPGLEGIIKTAVVSPYFYQIYKNKIDRTKRDAPKLKALLSRHNFYDLQTILNLTGRSGRRVMIMQADMDVVSDGSDGDRLPTMPDDIVNSTHYQPSTSYFWKKQTNTPNPMIKGFEKRVVNAKQELAAAETTGVRRAWLEKRLKELETKIEDMKWHSYLIAEHDPFIVIPVSMLKHMEDVFAPKVGDYAVVIYEGKLFPCIVGDGGPTFKVGEASIRMARQLNKRASPYSRPVSNLTVTYLVFPNSRESVKSAPDYQLWREKCEELIGQIGGLSPDYQLHDWTNTLPLN